MKHTCLRKIEYMLQDFVVETAAAAADDENDDDTTMTMMKVVVLFLRSASSYAVTTMFPRGEKKLRIII